MEEEKGKINFLFKWRKNKRNWGEGKLKWKYSTTYTQYSMTVIAMCIKNLLEIIMSKLSDEVQCSCYSMFQQRQLVNCSKHLVDLCTMMKATQSSDFTSLLQFSQLNLSQFWDQGYWFKPIWISYCTHNWQPPLQVTKEFKNLRLIITFSLKQLYTVFLLEPGSNP